MIPRTKTWPNLVTFDGNWTKATNQPNKQKTSPWNKTTPVKLNKKKYFICLESCLEEKQVRSKATVSRRSSSWMGSWRWVGGVDRLVKGTGEEETFSTLDSRNGARGAWLSLLSRPDSPWSLCRLRQGRSSVARGSNGKDRADTCVSYLCDTGAGKDFLNHPKA